jgi:8-hydroxy-5-deazaflavin:NADPH oxidoreductase
MRIAILGGTGNLGAGLAHWWASAGHCVIIGSRDAAKAEAAAQELAALLPAASVSGSALGEAARAADIVVIAIPYAAQRATLTLIRNEVAGKLVVDTTVPLRPPKVSKVQLPQVGCAALEAQAILGPDVKLVAAFQNVSAHGFTNGQLPECDVLVSSDDAAAAQTIIDLIETGGMKAWYAGPLANSAAAEALTSVLIAINRRYGSKGSGLRIVLNKQPH